MTRKNGKSQVIGDVAIIAALKTLHDLIAAKLGSGTDFDVAVCIGESGNVEVKITFRITKALDDQPGRLMAVLFSAPSKVLDGNAEDLKSCATMCAETALARIAC